MGLFLYLASLFYFSPSELPSSHSATEASAKKVSLKSMPFEVMWHDIEIQAFLVQKVWLLHRGFFCSYDIKMFQSPKSLERFNLYVTADLVTVCIGSTVQTRAEKEKPRVEKTLAEATSCYSSTCALLKQSHHFCAFMYLLTIRKEQQCFLSIWFYSTSTKQTFLQLHPSAKFPCECTQTPFLQSILHCAQAYCY